MSCRTATSASTRSATARGARSGRLDLTRTEFALLELFVRSAERVLTRSEILVAVWGYDFGPTSNSLEVYVGYLRRKLEEGGASAADPNRAWRRLRHAARAMTIGKRVIFATSAALVAVVVLLSVFAYQLVKRELYSRIDVTLQTRVTSWRRLPSPAGRPSEA